MNMIVILKLNDKMDSREWKKWKDLRKAKNRLMKKRKRRWLEDKFQQHRLNGREGWMVAAEVRDIYKDREAIIPTILTGDEQAVNKNEIKAEIFNQTYHRFDNLPELKENTFYLVNYHGIQ